MAKYQPFTEKELCDSLTGYCQLRCCREWLVRRCY